MGRLQKCKIIYQTPQNPILVLLFFLILTSSSHMTFLAQGRVMSKQVESSQKYVRERRNLIGSSPPRCDKMRCVTCGHCEAVQVPIAPRITHDNLKTAGHGHHHIHFNEKTPTTIAYSRGDGISNYMPMCWKCKCGDYIFNP